MTTERAHPAVTPLNLERTGQDLLKAGWPEDHSAVYDLVRRLTLAALAAHPVIEEHRRLFSVPNGPLAAFGWSTLREAGWRNLLTREPLPEPALPYAGSTVTGDVSLEAISAEPTGGPASLRLEDLVEMMKAEGIGTPATYAPVVTGLFGAGWVVRSPNGTVALSPEGLDVVQRIHATSDLPLLDVEFSRRLDHFLEEVENGTALASDAARLFPHLVEARDLDILPSVDDSFAGVPATVSYARRDERPVPLPRFTPTTGDPEADLPKDHHVRVARDRLFDVLARAGVEDRREAYAIEAVRAASTIEEGLWRERCAYDALVRWALMIRDGSPRNPTAYAFLLEHLAPDLRRELEESAVGLAEALRLRT